jgi:flagellar assembly protein FliH
LFRIERRNVNLSATRSFQVEISEDPEAGAVGEAPEAAVSATIDVHAQQMAQAQEKAQEIIKKAEAEAKANAEKILADARNEVAALMLTTREEAEEERKRAWQEGYAEGSEKGKQSYDEKLAEKIREDDEMVKRVIHEIYDERERIYSGLEDEVIGLALEIVRKVIHPAEELIGDVFESLIKNALRQMTPEGKIILRVGSADYERFFSSGSAVFEFEGGVTVTASVLRDVSLGIGDCIIDTEESTVNAGLDTQLKYIKLAFDKADN